MEDIFYQQSLNNNIAQIPNGNERVTSLEDLKIYAQGTTVEFPSFAEGQPFVARVRRPSMMSLASEGKIPNSLMSSATELFAKGTEGMQMDDDLLKEMYDICRIICQASLISPTLEEIESVGLTLSDDQVMAIFSYAQAGVKALESFR